MRLLLFPDYSPAYREFLIGYQYYGGIATWRNPLGTFPSCGPVKVAMSKPNWMLAAQVVARPDGVNWSFPTTPGSGWSTLPAHRNAVGTLPAGGNEVFIDGSAKWVKAKGTMMFIHSWNPVRELYIYQEDLGALEPQRASLKRDTVSTRGQWAAAVSVFCFACWLWAATAGAALAPYPPNADTLHLWHLDESTPPCLDSAPGGTNLTSLAGGATLSNSSFPGFGTALSTLDGGQSGTAAASLDALLAARPLVSGTGDDTAMAFTDTLNGAFTFEAIVRVDFN